MKNEMAWWNPSLDRSRWEHGEWDDEPDKIQWIDEDTGLDCLIVRNRMGALCGYVGVPDTHPFHGMEYEEPSVRVHGGLTFAAGCQKSDDPAEGICHIPAEGRPDNVWWFGFDCLHIHDIAPGTPSMPEGWHDGCSYRNVSYVTAEVTSLAHQLIGAQCD